MRVHPQQCDASVLSLGKTCLLVGGARFDRRRRGGFLYSDRVTELEGNELHELPALGTKCLSPGLVRLADDSALAVGGETHEGGSTRTWSWSRATKAWRPGPSMAAPRVNPGVFLQPNGRVVIVGGVRRRVERTIEIGEWSDAAPPQIEQLIPNDGAAPASIVPVECPTMQLSPADCPPQPVLGTVLASGDVLVVEAIARRELGRDVVSCVRITPDGEARPAQDAPCAAPFALAPLPTGALLLSTSGQTVVYSERDGTWADGPKLGAVGRASACALADGRVVVVGGDGVDPETRMVYFRDAIVVVDPSRGTAADAGRLRHARRCPRLAVLDDAVIAFGGQHPEDEEGELVVERWGIRATV